MLHLCLVNLDTPDIMKHLNILFHAFVLLRTENLEDSKYRAVVHKAGGMDIEFAHNLRNLNEAEAFSFYQAALHHCIISLLAMLGLLLQVKQASESKSAFVTDHVTMLTFIAVLLIYMASLATLKTLQSLNSELAQFMNDISLLFGSLAAVLLLLILVRAFGWFTLGLWIFYFVRDILTKESYRKAIVFMFSEVNKLFKGQNQQEAEKEAGEHSVDENKMNEQCVAGNQTEQSDA